MTSEVTRSPAVIAEEIRGIKSRTSAILGAAIDVARASCFEIGRLLEEAKSGVPHGEWGKWLEENVSYSVSTANNLMKIYREFGGEQIDMLTGKCPRDVFEGLTQSQMVALFDLPEEERIPFVEANRETIEDGISVRELRRQIEEYKDKLELAEIQRDEAKRVEGVEFDKRLAAEEQLDAARAELEELKNNPVEATVVVHSPSEEQVEQLRAEVEREIRGEYDEMLAGQREDAAELRAKAEEESKRADELAEELKRAKAETDKDKKKADDAAKKGEADMEKLRAEVAAAAEREAAIRREYEAKLRVANVQSDARAAKVKLFCGEAQRYISAIDTELTAMEADAAGSGTKMRAQVAVMLDKLIAGKGLSV